VVLGEHAFYGIETAQLRKIPGEEIPALREKQRQHDRSALFRRQKSEVVTARVPLKYEYILDPCQGNCCLEKFDTYRRDRSFWPTVTPDFHSVLYSKAPHRSARRCGSTLDTFFPNTLCFRHNCNCDVSNSTRLLSSSSASNCDIRRAGGYFSVMG